ncbi:hypothetical protein KP509_07G096100 [Ceratopteris richardii]|uniref:Myb-like domain-containing protein n=1 Tax=Ceratopteris richardii TaxID=49495 RepID=A0A8T2UJG8_CERRI|nr:hypothetical protein KP509_07G096100 [Ceratopteris richardii]KAH7433987.1 hypothetical protein KP509_07G096100 [Ceratopteris richardii]
MLAKEVLSEDEKVVDPQLGYPRGYAKLCRHAYIQMQGLITPFTEGPPQRFLPYAPLDEELGKLREFDTLFPLVDEAERDPSSARRYAGMLWQQLDHLGNAGFDPARFRVDSFGNVLYWDADPGSPLAWEVDHWFPHSRGGRTVVSNLRIVQWQVNQRKSTKLEFLVPWWDLQLGVSVNQFLSVFSSKNADFRQRAFAWFFTNGESEQLDENLVVECHSWPQPFRERKHGVGLAAAAIVRVQREMEDSLKVLNGNTTLRQSVLPLAATPARRRWSPDEEDALRRALQKFGPGNWKEIKESEPILANRSTVQIKDKFRLMKGDWDKENRDDPSSDCQIAMIQREHQLKLSIEEEKKRKQEQLIDLDHQVQQLKEHNEKEKEVLQELECSLSKNRKRVEKQRKLSETQGQYRHCLEKMIRDTMHQCVLYKEQARLNQVACNALVARLESQKSACDSAEADMMVRIKQRESLEALVRPQITKRTRNVAHSDVCGYMKLDEGIHTENKEKENQGIKLEKPSDSDKCRRIRYNRMRRRTNKVMELPDRIFLPSDKLDKTRNSDTRTSNQFKEGNGLKAKNHAVNDQRVLRESPEKSSSGTDESAADGLKSEEGSLHHFDGSTQDVLEESVSPSQSNESAGVKRKASETNETDVDMLKMELEDAYSAQSLQINDDRGSKARDREQLDELLQEVLEMKGKVSAAMAEAIEDEDEEERVKRVGKFNIDKWLQALLFTGKEMDSIGDDNGEKSITMKPGKESASKSPDRIIVAGSTRGGKLSDFLKKMSFRHQQDHENPEILEVVTELPKVLVLRADEDPRAEVTSRTEMSIAKEEPDKITALTSGQKATEGDKGSSKDVKAEERRVMESFSRLKLGSGNGPKAIDTKNSDSSTENSEVAYQIACETEFVEKMKASREREQRRKSMASAGIRPQLQQLFEDSTSQEFSPCEQKARPSSTFSDRMSGLEQRRWSIGMKPQQQIQSTLKKLPMRHQQSSNHEDHGKPQQHPHHSLTKRLPQTVERRPSNSPTQTQALPRRAASPAPLRRGQAEEENIQQRQQGPGEQAEERWKRRQSPSSAKQEDENLKQTYERHMSSGLAAPSSPRHLLSRQLMAGAGGAARKANMLMRSASTRASASPPGGSPTRSSSSGGAVAAAVRRSGEGDTDVGSIRRKASFFQDWDVNENLRASLSHVWRKAVKKFDLARQQSQPCQHGDSYSQLPR